LIDGAPDFTSTGPPPPFLCPPPGAYTLCGKHFRVGKFFFFFFPWAKKLLLPFFPSPLRPRKTKFYGAFRSVSFFPPQPKTKVFLLTKKPVTPDPFGFFPLQNPPLRRISRLLAFACSLAPAVFFFHWAAKTPPPFFPPTQLGESSPFCRGGSPLFSPLPPSLFSRRLEDHPTSLFLRSDPSLSLAFPPIFSASESK